MEKNALKPIRKTDQMKPAEAKKKIIVGRWNKNPFGGVVKKKRKFRPTFANLRDRP